jgi:hypothetical protein
MAVPRVVVQQLEDEAIADEVHRLQPDWLRELQQNARWLVGRFELPPVTEAKRLLVGGSGPLEIGDAQPYVIEHNWIISDLHPLVSWIRRGAMSCHF